MIEELMKPSEVAALFGVSRTWIYDAAASGRIPNVRLGDPDGPLRFVRSELEAWLELSRSDWSPGRSDVRALRSVTEAPRRRVA